ncbi:OmpP1/FadL family transporter [Rhodoblastus sp.]|uniref:OmpP1/FadL family transporter n=1 Tax=Rhodoblastus sp. TaxID=1962975 RepID=UPI003F9C630A
MHKLRFPTTAAVAALSLGVFAGQARAADGLFLAGTGTIDKSFAGGGIANPEDASSLASNPAGLLTAGHEFVVNQGFVSPFTQYSSNGLGLPVPGTHKNDEEIWPMGSAFYSSPIDGDSAWGLGAYPITGLGTRYNVPPTGPFGNGSTSIFLAEGIISLGYAHRFGDVTLGVAPMLAINAVRVTGLPLGFGAFSTNAADFTNKGYDYSVGFGARASVDWNVAPNFRVALAGSSPIANSAAAAYSGLFPSGGHITTPATIQAGLAWDYAPAVTVMVDYKHIFYSSSAAFSDGTNFNQLLAGVTKFGAPNGPGFGSKDVDSITLSGEWRVDPRLALRAGYTYSTEPVQSSQIALAFLAPTTGQNTLAAGAGYQLTEKSTLDFGINVALWRTVTGPLPAAIGGGNMTVGATLLDASLGYTYHFDQPVAKPVVLAKY